jgi:hypothetical protein
MINRANELALLVVSGLMSVVVGCGDQSSPVPSLDLGSEEAPNDLSLTNLKTCPFCVAKVKTLVSGSQPITGLAANGKYVFWSAKPDLNESANYPVVFQVPVTGGGHTTVYAPAQAPQNASSIVLDQTNVYFLAAVVASSSYTLWYAPQSGGAPQSILSGFEDQPQPIQGCAVRPACTPFGTPGEILAAIPDAGLFAVHQVSSAWVSRTLSVPVDMPNVYYPMNVTADANNAYFVKDTASPPSVFQVSLSGGAPIALATAALGSPIATDGAGVYFVIGTSIVRIPVNGGAGSTFAADSGPPTTFAVDNGDLYWTCTSCGTVSKKAFSGGATKTIASGQLLPKFVALGPSHVYWSASDALGAGVIRYRSK